MSFFLVDPCSILSNHNALQELAAMSTPANQVQQKVISRCNSTASNCESSNYFFFFTWTAGTQATDPLELRQAFLSLSSTSSWAYQPIVDTCKLGTSYWGFFFLFCLLHCMKISCLITYHSPESGAPYQLCALLRSLQPQSQAQERRCWLGAISS
jgi:nitric oxide reductase large subunit